MSLNILVSNTPLKKDLDLLNWRIMMMLNNEAKKENNIFC